MSKSHRVELPCGSVGFVSFVCRYRECNTYEVGFRDGTSFRVERESGEFLADYSGHPLAHLGPCFVESFDSIEAQEFEEWKRRNPHLFTA